MLSFPPAVRIWLALAPADLRKGFDALAELVRQHLRDDPLSGHVFVFRKRRSDRIKLLPVRLRALLVEDYGENGSVPRWEWR